MDVPQPNMPNPNPQPANSQQQAVTPPPSIPAKPESAPPFNPPPDNKPKNSPPEEKSSHIISPYLISLILFLVGICLGYALTKLFPGNNTANIQQKVPACKETSKKVTCPVITVIPTIPSASYSATASPSGTFYPTTAVKLTPTAELTKPPLPSL